MKSSIKSHLLQKINLNIILAVLVILIFPLALSTIYLFPLFPDEIQIRIWLSRTPYDFPNRVTGLARCWSEFIQPIPILQYPPAIINWLLNGLVESPTSLRRIGVIVPLLWLSFLGYFLNNNSHERKVNIYSIAIIISLFFMGGIVPIFLGINRNEQLFFPSIIALLYISFYNKDNCQNVLITKITIILIYVTSISLILYAHPKGLFLLPFFITTAILASKINKHYYLSCILITLLSLISLSYSAYYSWSAAYLCKEIPEFEKFLRGFSFSPFTIISDHQAFVSNAIQSISRFGEYLDQLTFKREYIWNFLPSQSKNYIIINIINYLIKLNFLAALSLSIFLLPYFYYKNDLKNKKIITFNLVLIILTSCIFISATFNLTKNIYDAVYYYVVLCIILVFLLKNNNLLRFDNIIFKNVCIYLFLFSITSQSIFIANNLKPFLGGFTGPGIPIGLYENQKIHQAIQQAADMCKIHPVDSQFVVIDDLTYGFFRKSRGPISFTYNFVGESKTPLRDLFSQTDSSGMIINCQLMPSEFQPKSTRVGTICCLSKEQIKKYFID